jgi:chromosome partitioning protein
MPVVAVINRKGGSGKSTLATHLAGYCAHRGMRVMLGDVDRQQSSLSWLRRRSKQAVAARATIAGWAVDNRSIVRPPAGITHVVLDTPGGLRGLDLARVVMNADAILMPVCNSAFDRESAADCYAELMTLPRVASGRCKVALVGMRLDARTKADARLVTWAAQHKLPYVGAIRETQVYVRSAEQGLTLFDLPAAKVEADLAQWRSIVGWLEAAWEDAVRAGATPGSPPQAATAANAPGAPTRHVPVDPFEHMPSPSQFPTLSASNPRPTRRGLVDRFGWLFTVFRSSN